MLAGDLLCCWMFIFLPLYNSLYVLYVTGGGIHTIKNIHMGKVSSHINLEKGEM